MVKRRAVASKGPVWVLTKPPSAICRWTAPLSRASRVCTLKLADWQVSTGPGSPSRYSCSRTSSISCQPEANPRVWLALSEKIRSPATISCSSKPSKAVTASPLPRSPESAGT